MLKDSLDNLNQGQKLRISLALLVILTVVFFYFVIRNHDPFAELKGTLYYTVSYHATGGVSNMHIVDLATGHDEILLNDDYIKFNPHSSPLSSQITYTAAPIEFSSTLIYPYTDNLQIMLYDPLTSKVEEVTNERSTFQKKDPRWSPDGKFISFSGYTKEEWEQGGTIHEPSNWAFFIYDIDKKTTEQIGRGYNPHWSPDGTKILYMENDGIYIYDITSGTSNVIIPYRNFTYKNRADTSMTFDVSDDGSLLVLSSPYDKDLIIYEITSWELYTFKTRERLPVNGHIYYPLFSPDKKFVAVVEGRFGDPRSIMESDLKNPMRLAGPTLIHTEIAIYDLETLKKSRVKDLTESFFYGSSLSDWVY